MRKSIAKKEKEGGMMSHLEEDTWKASRKLLQMLSTIVDQVLACFNYDDYEKVKMVTYEFTRYVLVWWNQFCKADLICELRTKFVPKSYARDLYNKLQRMYQGSKSVEEYHKDMEVALIRENMLESNEKTKAHFLPKLNKDIQDIMELYHYASMDDLVHQVIQVEA
ncbi:hypothetical protein CR513_49312, partial [Mucuna pruriens]